MADQKANDQDRSSGTPYPKVESRPDFPAIERAILEGWERDKTFRRSVEFRPGGDNEYTFFDGPPFANGLPHYGHILTGYVKDVVPRYQTMRGRRVERRFGWDCHGLPAEMEAEKEYGVSGRKQIEEYGVARFNDNCRTSVMKFTKEWQRYVHRMARWVDFDNDYKTMDLPYMESVVWAFKQLYDKGLIYEDYRVVPYSWAAETPLSNFEIRMDDATRPRQDPAITVAFALHPADGDPGPMSMLAWTTTPWTLPSNLGLAVGPDIDYAVVESDGHHYVLGADTLGAYAEELGEATHVATLKGSDLVERTYEPLFGYFSDTENSFRVLGADFVDTTEGTGIVHIAPGFGEDDQTLGAASGLGIVVPVDDHGNFTSEVTDWAGQNVLQANAGIIGHLKERGAVLKHATYEHNYPHCWRTDEPIIYKALSSWYVKVSALTDRLLEKNSEINWIPEHVRDGQFGRWLAGARDWSISRNRFWGTPIPVWRSDDPAYPRIDVYGGLDEIERDFGVRPDDLHRPYIDELVRPNPDDPTGRSMMRRVPEVLDCWFESGSMPFASIHYPFENVEEFESHFPADFIVEYIAQTRGWFYTLHVLGVALFDRPPFRNVICHGVVLDEDGRKLSKKLRNYPDPEEMFETVGSDALRWYLMASPILRGGNLRIASDGSGISDVVRLVVNPIWNAYSFFTLYANIDGYRARRRAESTQLLDRYILAKTHELVADVTGHLDAYDLPAACADITAFLDALNNWYIRRSRTRFWAPASGAGSDAADKRDAYDSLYTVLTTLSEVAAPLLPMICEEIHGGLTDGDSVHLTDWPDADSLPADPDLVAAMDRVRDVCSTALGLREDHGLRTRLPLASLTVAGHDAESLSGLIPLIADEVNVKIVELTEDLEAYATFVLKPNGRVLGPRLGRHMKTVFAAAKSGDWTRAEDRTVVVAGHELGPDEYEIALVPREGETAAALRSGDAIVSLDTEVTPELESEGIARDLVRLVQQARKDAGLNVTDRVSLTLDLPDSLAEAVAGHESYIASQVLASSVGYAEIDDGTEGTVGDGTPVRLTVAVS